MTKCCVSLLCEVLCEAAFEPIIVCDDDNPICCSDRVLQVFEYTSKQEFLSKSMREIINAHFDPSKVIRNGVTYPSSVTDLTFANIKNSDCLKSTAITKVKTWSVEGRTLYSIAIRDIPIITMANAPLRKASNANEDQSLFNTAIPDRAFVNLDLEPQIRDRLHIQFSQMADALPSLVWIVSNTGELLYQNSRVFETLGVNTITENWQDCCHPDDLSDYLPRWRDSLANGLYIQTEMRYRNISTKNDGDGNQGYRWHFLQSTPIKSYNGNVRYSVCNAVDVQALKESEAEKQRLIASEKLATEASKLKSAFLSMMSHEIRTPLFGIVGNTSLLMDTNITKLQKEYVKNIDASAKLMMSVIQDILDFSRIEAGKFRVRSEPFSFNRIIDICTRMVRTAAERKGLEFRSTTLEKPVKAMGDSMRILQVLTNLASNAIKFTSTGSVSINFEHHLNESNELVVKFSVTDTGIGMDDELKSRLFTPWVQGDSSSRRLYGGSGLGLAISKALLDMMKGEIGIISEPGKGSNFWFQLTLPALASDFDTEKYTSPCESPMGDAKFEFCNISGVPRGNPVSTVSKVGSMIKEKSRATKKGKGKYRVLLAEDNPINQAILKRFLEKMGIKDYFLASDGQVALDEYLSRPPRYYDIVLLDQSMPKMDGDMVCRHIRQLDTAQVVVSVSANALLADQEGLKEIGMNDHIPKPVNFATFSEVLKRWLEKTPSIYASSPLATPPTDPSTTSSIGPSPGLKLDQIAV